MAESLSWLFVIYSSFTDPSAGSKFTSFSLLVQLDFSCSANRTNLRVTHHHRGVLDNTVWQPIRRHDVHNVARMSSAFPSGPFGDCYQARQAGFTTSGIYLLKAEGMEHLMQAWCEHGLDNGGWTVIQCRRDGSVNFFRNWDTYKVGPRKPRKSSTDKLLLKDNLTIKARDTLRAFR